MRTIRFSLTLSACLALAAGCTPPTTSKTSVPSTATASLKVAIRPEQAYDESYTWSINEMRAMISEVAVLKNGSEVSKLNLGDSSSKDIAYSKSFRSLQVPAGTYDGLKLFLSLENLVINQDSATHSAAVALSSPLTFAKSVEIPANKRTVLIFKPNLRKMGVPDTFALTPDSFTVDTRLQDLVSPDGYPMAYLNHFDNFSFDDPDGITEYGDRDLNPGPYGDGGAPQFFSYEVNLYADLGEKSLKSVTEVPPAEQFVARVGITPGHSYVVKTTKGKYAKFRVTALAGDEHRLDDLNAVAIEYHYQSDGATTFSK